MTKKQRERQSGVSLTREEIEEVMFDNIARYGSSDQSVLVAALALTALDGERDRKLGAAVRSELREQARRFVPHGELTGRDLEDGIYSEAGIVDAIARALREEVADV